MQSGQLATLPLVLFVFGYLNVLGDAEYPVSNVGAIVAALARVPKRDLFWSVVIGVEVSMGYCLYYFGATGVVPVAVLYALSQSGTLVCVLVNIVVFREFSMIPLLSPTFACIAFGSMCYGASMFIFMKYTFS